MGYTTEFYGSFEITPPMSLEHKEYINSFSATRRMKRNAEMTVTIPDPAREAVGLPIGDEGAYFVGATGFRGQNHATDVVDYNSPPAGQPSLWCQWIVNDSDQELEWDQGGKFYDYCDWLEYLIEHFFKPWGYTLNGSVEWQGEERDDMGMLVLKNNELNTLQGRVHYE